MSANDKNANVVRDGRPWTTVGQFPTWEAADLKRKSLVDEKNGVRVKVRRRHSSPVFTVVLRQDVVAQAQDTEEKQRNPKGKKARKAEEQNR